MTRTAHAAFAAVTAIAILLAIPLWLRWGTSIWLADVLAWCG